MATVGGGDTMEAMDVGITVTTAATTGKLDGVKTEPSSRSTSPIKPQDEATEPCEDAHNDEAAEPCEDAHNEMGAELNTNNNMGPRHVKCTYGSF
jgi:hypothetical protein